MREDVDEQVDGEEERRSAAQAQLKAHIGEAAWQQLLRARKIFRVAMTTPVATVGVVVLVVLRTWARTDRVHLQHLLHSPRRAWDGTDEVFALLGAAALAVILVALLVAGITTLWLRARLAALAQSGLDPEEVSEALGGELIAEELEAVEREEQIEATARDRLVEEVKQGPSWWRTELSGGHLVWWIAVAVVAAAAAGFPLPDRVWGPALAIVVAGGLIKIPFWILYYYTTDAARVGRLRFYRWWARGWAPVLAALAPAGAWWVVQVM